MVSPSRSLARFLGDSFLGAVLLYRLLELRQLRLEAVEVLENIRAGLPFLCSRCLLQISAHKEPRRLVGAGGAEMRARRFEALGVLGADAGRATTPQGQRLWART